MSKHTEVVHMAEQGEGTGTQAATGDTGAAAGTGQKTDSKQITYTAEDLSREADRRVNEAAKKWRAEQAELLAAKDKDAATKIAELTAKAAEGELYQEFTNAAIPAGIINLKAAFVLAKQLDYFTRGKLDLDRFKTDHPYLFNPQNPQTTRANPDAGRGAGKPNGSPDMNAFIRAAAGYR